MPGRLTRTAKLHDRSFAFCSQTPHRRSCGARARGPDCATMPKRGTNAIKAAPQAAAQPAESAEARMVRTGRELFLARGYGATSLNEIARAARVSKATLYARFPSKADLLRAVI